MQQSNPAELWQQPAQAVRRQHDGELPQQLYAHHMHLQSRDVPELITAGSSDGLASSINSRSGRLLSLPSDSQQISVGGSSIGRYSISRPGEVRMGRLMGQQDLPLALFCLIIAETSTVASTMAFLCLAVPARALLAQPAHKQKRLVCCRGVVQLLQLPKQTYAVRQIALCH